MRIDDEIYYYISQLVLTEMDLIGRNHIRIYIVLRRVVTEIRGHSVSDRDPLCPPGLYARHTRILL